MMYLIYINYIGVNHKGLHEYEFIFSDTIKSIDGEDWDKFPASGQPSPPNDIFIKRVGRLVSSLKLDLVQNSDTFAVWDAVDGVIALGWENINAYDAYPEHRISFKFGMTMDEVEATLYNKELILKYENKNDK